MFTYPFTPFWIITYCTGLKRTEPSVFVRKKGAAVPECMTVVLDLLPQPNQMPNPWEISNRALKPARCDRRLLGL